MSLTSILLLLVFLVVGIRYPAVLLFPMMIVIGMVLVRVMGKGKLRRPRLLFGGGAMQERSFDLLFALIGKIAKSDGRVVPPEIGLLERLMEEELRLAKSEQRRAVRSFRAGKDSQESFADLAARFRRSVGDDAIALLSALELFVRVAAADGRVEEREFMLLMQAARSFRLHPQYLQMMLRLCDAELEEGVKTAAEGAARSYAMHGGTAMPRTEARDPVATAYSTLNCSPSASESELRAAYRQLVKHYHPDAVAGRSLPREFERKAEAKFREIQAAYEVVREARRLS